MSRTMLTKSHPRKAVYYGWVIAITLAITETISWGIVYYAFSVFITPMETTLGWTRSELTGAFSLALLMMGAVAFPVGAWIDKHGSRFLMTVGSILASLLVIAWSQVTTLSHFYLIWAGLGICGGMILYDPAFTVIATWFVKQRGRALAVITLTAGFASTIFIPLADALYHLVEWRDAVLLLGILLAVTTIPPHALVLRRRPQDFGWLPDGVTHNTSIEDTPSLSRDFSLSSALTQRFFWFLTFAFSLSVLAASAIRIHIIPFLTASGVDASTAALASGSIGVMQVLGRIVFVPLEKRVSIHTLVTSIFAMQMIALLVLLLDVSWLVIVLFIVLFGSAYGAKTLTRAAIIADSFGTSHYGRISSVMSIFLVLASTAAPIGAGLMYDHFKSYTPMIWLLVSLSLAATLMMGLAKHQGLAQPSSSVFRITSLDEE